MHNTCCTADTSGLTATCCSLMQNESQHGVNPAITLIIIRTLKVPCGVFYVHVHLDDVTHTHYSTDSIHQEKTASKDGCKQCRFQTNQLCTCFMRKEMNWTCWWDLKDTMFKMTYYMLTFEIKSHMNTFCNSEPITLLFHCCCLANWSCKGDGVNLIPWDIMK